MIQDIEPKKLYNTYDPNAVPEEGDVLLRFSKGRLLVVYRCNPDGTRIGDYWIPRWNEIAIYAKKLYYLFRIDSRKYFLLWESEEDTELIPALTIGYKSEYLTLKQLRRDGRIDRLAMFAAYTGYHLWNWYETERFCGHCGAPLVPDNRLRMMKCEKCGREFFPRINPAVIVAVRNGDRLLMTRYADSYGVPFYALIAGFTEIGETLEQTVAREVFEEVGLKVSGITYYKSQPWGIESDILAGFVCDVDGSDEIRMDKRELKEAVWVERSEVTGQPTDYALTNEMMLAFRDGKL